MILDCDFGTAYCFSLGYPKSLVVTAEEALLHVAIAESVFLEWDEAQGGILCTLKACLSCLSSGNYWNSSSPSCASVRVFSCVHFQAGTRDRRISLDATTVTLMNPQGFASIPCVCKSISQSTPAMMALIALALTLLPLSTNHAKCQSTRDLISRSELTTESGPRRNKRSGHWAISIDREDT